MDLKKNGKVFTSKFVGTGPSSCEKKNLPGSGLTKVGKHWATGKGVGVLFLKFYLLNADFGETKQNWRWIL